jgi:hypothetical protein
LWWTLSVIVCEYYIANIHAESITVTPQVIATLVDVALVDVAAGVVISAGAVVVQGVVISMVVGVSVEDEQGVVAKVVAGVTGVVSTAAVAWSCGFYHGLYQ